MQVIVILYVILIAFTAGMLGALLGIGGGAVLVPLLDFLAEYGLLEGVTFHEIIATSLVCTIATSSVSSSIYIKKKLTNIRLGIILSMMNILGVFIGTTLLVMLSARYLKALFGGLLIFMSINMFRKRKTRKTMNQKIGSGVDPIAERLGLSGAYYDEAEGRVIKYSVRNSLKGVVLSFFGGLVAGLFGVGGGVINVPILVAILGVPPKVATATSLFIIGLNGATGGLVFLLSGLINLILVSSAITGILFGALIGTRFLVKIRNETLRRVFAIFLFYVAIRMIVKSVGFL